MIFRTYCDTLSEMRELLKHISIWNYSRTAKVLFTLIEECQTYGNRMESALEYRDELKSLHAERKKLKAEVKKLKADKKLLSPADSKDGDDTKVRTTMWRSLDDLMEDEE